jgi:hypothetical protein
MVIYRCVGAGLVPARVVDSIYLREDTRSSPTTRDFKFMAKYTAIVIKEKK